MKRIIFALLIGLILQGYSIAGTKYYDWASTEVITAARLNMPWDSSTEGISATNVKTLILPDNTATAFDVKEGANSYLSFTTTNSGEKLTLSKALNTTKAITITGAGSSSTALSIGGSAGDGGGGVIDVSPTWNTVQNPTAILVNPTNSASGATTKLMDLQIGSASKFSVDKSGNTVIAGTTTGTGTITGPMLSTSFKGTTASISTNQTSYNVAAKSVLLLTAGVALTGLAGGTSGQVLYIVAATSNTCSLKHGGGTQPFDTISGSDVTGYLKVWVCVCDGTNWYIAGQ